MDDYKGEKFIDIESIESYEKSDVIINIFFGILDLILIVMSFLNLKAETGNILILNHKLIKLFLIDVIIRILYTRRYNDRSLIKEVFLNSMNSIQFYLIISFLSLSLKTFTKSLTKRKIVQICAFFFLITFSYDKLALSSYSSPNLFIILMNKTLSLIQFLSILYCLYKLYSGLKKNINNIGKDLMGNSQILNKILKFILGSPTSCYILYTLYYLLKIIVIFVINPVFVIYINILINIIKETSKYFLFVICQMIIFQLNLVNFQKTESSYESKGISQYDEEDSLKN